MRRFLSAALAVAIAAPASFAVTAPASAAKWWKCESGYNLEGPNNAAVRCVKPATTIVVALAPCPPPPWTMIANNPPVRDQCRFPVNNSRTDRICPLPTDTYNSVPGTDNCSRVTSPADSKPPSVEVQR
jgi:hypothetical protein